MPEQNQNAKISSLAAGDRSNGPRFVHGLAPLMGLLLATGDIAAQEFSEPPAYGATNLAEGFPNDPFTVHVTSPGGSFDAEDISDDCYGFIDGSRPDFRLSYEAGINRLGILVNSDVDTTLVVRDPNGTWYCNDDDIYNLNNANPGITLETPQTGDYNIWVGTFTQGEVSDTTILAITEVDEVDWLGMDLGISSLRSDASFDATGDIVFGDDNSLYANDGECDDDRFRGTGMSAIPSAEHRFHDATDCRRLFDAGSLTLYGEGLDTPELASDGRVSSSAIDFGDNTSFYAGDGECDDPRFEGPGSAGVTLEDDRMRDAVDCRRLYDAGQIVLRSQDPEPVSSYAVSAAQDIEFGDNSSMWANDGECDDPRFEGPGVSPSPSGDDRMRDASDCRTLFERGSISLAGTTDGITHSIPDDIPAGAIFASTRPNPADARPSDPAPFAARNNVGGANSSTGTRILDSAVDVGDIDFGDNSSMWANDGECDDPRFEGPGSAGFTTDDDIGHDADDCRTLFNSGMVELAN